MFVCLLCRIPVDPVVLSLSLSVCLSFSFPFDMSYSKRQALLLFCRDHSTATPSKRRVEFDRIRRAAVYNMLSSNILRSGSAAAKEHREKSNTSLYFGVLFTTLLFL